MTSVMVIVNLLRGVLGQVDDFNSGEISKFHFEKLLSNWDSIAIFGHDLIHRMLSHIS